MSNRFTHTFFGIVFGAVFFIRFAGAFAAESQPLKNTQLLLKAVRSAVEELVSALDTAAVDSLVYQSVQDSTLLQQLIHYQVQALLREKKIELVDNPVSHLPSVSVLIIASDLSYGKPFKKGFLGKRKIERTASIHLIGHWQRGDGSISSEAIQHSVRDTIEMKEIPFVEKNDLLPGYPRHPGGGRWPWAEGFFAAGILSTVVYLFYAIRSQ